MKRLIHLRTSAHQIRITLDAIQMQFPLGGNISESSYEFGRLEAPNIMEDVVCQAADRNEYLERSLFRQNGARPIFYKKSVRNIIFGSRLQ